MAEDADRFDFSDYPKSHPLHSEVNKKVLGKMKDETKGEPIEEFVGLRSKMYCFKSKTKSEKRAKGVKKSTVQNDILHEDYFHALIWGNRRRHQMNSFRSENHQIYSLEQNKISLGPFDDKRYLLADGITSYAYGHRDIPERMDCEEN
jgi:hypothetical protein